MRREAIVIILSLIVISLGFIVIFKSGVLTMQDLATHKDAMSALKDIVTVIVVIVGAIFTYIKFFAGQTFTPKAQVILHPQILEITENLFLHSLKITLTNQGNISILKPEASIKIETIGPEGRIEIPPMTLESHKFAITVDSNRHIITVDPKESVHFLLDKEFNSEIWSVNYFVEVSALNGRVWHNMAMVENSIDSS